MTVFTLHLMRHGAPVEPGRLWGHRDVAVTEAGIARCVAQATDLPVARIVASDLARARHCAEAIDVAAIDPRWRELDLGTWDGTDPATIDPAALSRWHHDPDGHPPPGGERWSSLIERVGAAIDDLPPEPTLVVTHGGAIRAALAHLCGWSLDTAWTLQLDYASLLSLMVWDGAPRLAQVTGLRA
ncbi:histidine phosphatase family protein [Sphingomonas sp.]|jgi:alpha-ribazole phosphatase|uniref:histidine phosphatase family protein n=1 Tax=Sphingomonas sp. TaxID=28214 RepID=UPI0035C7E7B4